MKKIFNLILIKLGFRKKINFDEVKKAVTFSKFMELNVRPDSEYSFIDYLDKYMNQ